MKPAAVLGITRTQLQAAVDCSGNDHGPWDDLLALIKVEPRDPVFVQCTRVILGSIAYTFTAVLEDQYVDVDFRDSYSAYYSRTFRRHEPTTLRLHWFGAAVLEQEISTLSKEQRDEYLGYVTIRPRPFGTVGRTLLKPPAAFSTYPAASLATATERVWLYGQDLYVRGMPFMQQDYYFTRCAHVVMWMCHYAAYLRHEIGRRSIAEFSEPTRGSSQLYADALPSSGIDDESIAHTLAEFGLPTNVYTLTKHHERKFEFPLLPWAEIPEDPHAAFIYWNARSFSRIIARYINSDLPCILTGDTHAVVICGWLRGPTRPGSADLLPPISFVLHDDEHGPYICRTDPFSLCPKCRHDLADHLREEGQLICPSSTEANTDPGGQDVAKDASDTWGRPENLIVPIPPRLWLAAPAAEVRGGLLLWRKLDQLDMPAWVSALRNPPGLTFRTYASYAHLYKRKLKERGFPSDLRAQLCLTPMAEYVWVVELISRARRGEGTSCLDGDPSLTEMPSRPCVLGEVVFDGTASELSLEYRGDQQGFHAYHLPGVCVWWDRQGNPHAQNLDVSETERLFQPGDPSPASGMLTWTERGLMKRA